jgi:hypothetical protein
VNSLRVIAVLALLAPGVPASAQNVPSKPDQPAAPPNAPSASIKPYHAITPRQRLQWFAESTVGPETLAVGLFSAGIGTARDAPREYGGHWGGFAERYGMRLTGVSTGNAMEAGLGVIWGEDPRYFRAYHQSFAGRIRNVVGMSFLAHNRSGQVSPAYARYVAMPGNNFLSNTWRANSEANNRAAAVRTGLGFLGLMGKNAFTEFWPDVNRRVFRRGR